MPVSVIVGGQYGSEGKGKVALDLVRSDPTISAVVRPGGTNSGHTAYTADGRRIVLRQLPAGSVDGNVDVIIPAGAYVDPTILLRELKALPLDPARVAIDPRAHLISSRHRDWESGARLTETIGSTGSGTGAAVISRLSRFAPNLPMGLPVAESELLQPFLKDTVSLMRSALDRGERVVVEGTQGFGLSPIHGDAWPKATSRDTTAAAFLSEAGLAPSDADDVVLVLRTFPIRVAGDSGPLAHETTWEAIALDSAGPWSSGEFTSVTNRLRRVAAFDASIVKRAIALNQPHRIVLNHLDQVDFSVRKAERLPDRALRFVSYVESEIGRSIDALGLSEKDLRWIKVRMDA